MLTQMNMHHGYINGSFLKKIAAVSMLIDHIGYLILGYGILHVLPSWDPRYGKWYCLYRIMRCIGRIAFPVYAFLLAEGIVHTRDWRKYALRLGIFGLLSEIPFDLMAAQKLISWETQNVFFTLLIGLLTVKAAEAVIWRAGANQALLAWITVTGLGCIAAGFMRTDYSYNGVFLIVLLYLLRHDPLKKCIAGFCWIFVALGRMYFIWGLGAAFLLIYLYNGEPGSRKGKYVFYGFYPVHMIVLYLIFCWLMGHTELFL